MHNLCKDFAYLRLTRHDCGRTLDTSLFKMFQKKNMRRKLRDLILEFIDEKIQKTVNHSPVNHLIRNNNKYIDRRCKSLYEVI